MHPTLDRKAYTHGCAQKTAENNETYVGRGSLGKSLWINWIHVTNVLESIRFVSKTDI